MSIKDYWIEEVQKVKEFQEISNAEDPEILNLQNEITNLLDDQFIQDATEKGIARREKMLNIQPFADDTLASRRFRVGVKWDNQLPYSYKQLDQRLIDLVGEDGYTINLNHGAYTMIVRISLGVKRMLQDADLMVRNMAPSNLIITVDLLYNRYDDLAYFTYDELALKTYDQLRNEVLY